MKLNSQPKRYEFEKGVEPFDGGAFRGLMFAVVLIAFLGVIFLGGWLAGSAWGQTASIEAQWDYGQEEDVTGFHLFYHEALDTYALGYDLPIADYLPPPAYMPIPIALPPGEYFFSVTAYDSSDNESEYSNEAQLHVQDTVKPGPCQGLIMRIPVP